MRIAVVAILGAAAVVGCRATPRAGYTLDMNGIDMSLLSDDMAMPPDKCPPAAVEICGNGCDDDRNGYVDNDDPQCTTQMLVTFAITPSMNQPVTRLTLADAAPTVQMLDGNPLSSGAMATFNRQLSTSYYVALDGTGKNLTKVLADMGGLQSTNLNMITRDVCIFNGEVIVVEPLASGDTPAGGRLHRYQSDGKTEILPSVPVQGQLSACSSDGALALYVARSIGGGPSELVVLAPGVGGAAPAIVGAPIALPPSVVASKSCCATGTNCCNRLLDFAWIKHTHNFVGLFAPASATPDAESDSAFVAEFALDGGAGPFVDAGRWHGLGDFVP